MLMLWTPRCTLPLMVRRRCRSVKELTPLLNQRMPLTPQPLPPSLPPLPIRLLLVLLLSQLLLPIRLLLPRLDSFRLPMLLKQPTLPLGNLSRRMRTT